MSKMYSTANLSDKELKEQGNRLFSLHKYEDAANCYTKAIVSDMNRNACDTYLDDENSEFAARIFVRLLVALHSKVYFSSCFPLFLLFGSRSTRFSGRDDDDDNEVRTIKNSAKRMEI